MTGLSLNEIDNHEPHLNKTEFFFYLFNTQNNTTMKRVILAVCMLAAVGTFAMPATKSSYAMMKKGDGQHIPASQVPAPVMADFQMRYPTAMNTQWEKESEHGKTTYQAQFNTSNRKKVKAQWLADGTFLGEK
jgi:hypothetical protein